MAQAVKERILTTYFSLNQGSYMTQLSKYSIGVGDRFARQAEAQLAACIAAARVGVEVIPVWNKSHREHTIIGSRPESVRKAADFAVRKLGWTLPYHVDADHIRLDTVDDFIGASDFYTIDVADSIGVPADAAELDAFCRRHGELVGRLSIPGIESEIEIGEADLRLIAGKYLSAAQMAGRIQAHIEEARGGTPFITEVSMDETDSAQTPVELLVILAALADQKVPLQTIAPKFTGRFNKGVDYAGDLPRFEREFIEDLAVVRFAVSQYDLPANLKLSIHSGSDKFSLYGPVRAAIRAADAGIHLKTAGTTWLEEVIGLAEADGKGLALAKEIYTEAFEARQALCAPYATVIDIDPAALPSPADVSSWSAARFTASLRHDQTCPEYNPSLRQLIHVGYKIAAHMGDRYLSLIDRFEAETVARNVTANLFERHIKPLFID
ncbi:MAG: tagaturonate epimerase family protein [Capsulimonadaceae bacterium]|nr:tagaturonate epimerase family protein [Capsulimonadaceae bacterium]